MPSVCLSPFALMIKVLCPMRKLSGLDRAMCKSSVLKPAWFSRAAISRAQCQHRPRVRSPRLTLVLWISGASVTWYWTDRCCACTNPLLPQFWPLAGLPLAPVIECYLRGVQPLTMTQRVPQFLGVLRSQWSAWQQQICRSSQNSFGAALNGEGCFGMVWHFYFT